METLLESFAAAFPRVGAQHWDGNAGLPHGKFSLQRHLVLWMNHVAPSLLCAATTAFESLLSQDRE